VKNALRSALVWNNFSFTWNQRPGDWIPPGREAGGTRNRRSKRATI